MTKFKQEWGGNRKRDMVRGTTSNKVCMQKPHRCPLYKLFIIIIVM